MAYRIPTDASTFAKSPDLACTTTASPFRPKPRRRWLLGFFWRRIVWLWKNRDVVNNRAKWRRMERELMNK